ncbi:farnesol dehydrogenase-like [Zeugodacus cucurbitae]|uniref:farnesol dehydrogenase-like n=1 Tax=Zeugodacus cucurbitae TaxID=28588 RepID=UPI00059699C1|nr:farnesol dehydrogenase-like [Zeugodacus cucurbitae]
MERWANRVAVVTGASAGIGAAIVQKLAENGMVVVGLARRKEKIESLRDEVKPEARDRIHGIECDITVEQQIIDAFKEVEKTYGPVAVLVNNAGTGRETKLVKEGNTEDILVTLNTNVLGIVYSTREAFRSMKENGGDGHVFLINSVAGHNVPYLPNTNINMYAPTKYAVTAMTEVYRQEFLSLETKIKVTSISPGVTESEGIKKHRHKMREVTAMLQPEDIADGLIYCLGTPPHVQVHELTIKPVGATVW